MAERSKQSLSPHEPELPPGMAAALRGLYDAYVEVPAAVDQAVLRDAREGFWRRRRTWRIVRWSGAAAAAAAAVFVLALNLHRNRPGPAQVATTQTPGIAGDVNGDGRVDILDAYVLARKLDAKSASAREDVNGDGLVDRRDVDAVAAMAVKLPGGVQ